MNERHAFIGFALWTAVMLGLAVLLPTGSWTVDDAVKAIAADHGEGAWGSPIEYGKLRKSLTDEQAFPVLVPPFARQIAGGAEPGFSPYARLLAQVQEFFSRRGLFILHALIAISCAWLLARRGFAWAFLLLPLTFYGLVPWEHGLAMLLSLPAIFAVFASQEARMKQTVLTGALLSCAIALRLEYAILLVLLTVALFGARRREAVAFFSVTLAGTALLILASGPTEFFRQSALNHELPGWATLAGYLTSRVSALWDMLIAMGGDLVQSLTMLFTLFLAVALLNKDRRGVLWIAGWVCALLFAAFAIRVVWKSSAPLPPVALLSCGSLLFAMPWLALLIVSKSAWKTKAMVYAIAAVVLGILLAPTSQGVHWGARLLLFAAPLFVIAFYQADLHRSRAFAVVLALTVVQTANSAVLVYARYTETTQHAKRVSTHDGSPMITTTRAQAIDLFPLWRDEEFFVASTSEDLERVLVEFYVQRQDSAWLHLDSQDSLFVKTFPANSPVWPHRMSIINAGGLYKRQWRLYQLVMNRGDQAWIPLIEAAAARAMQAGDTRRALFMQEDALALDTSRAVAHSNLALLLAKQGMLGEAQKAIARALTLDSTLLQARELASQIAQAQSAASTARPDRTED